MIQGTTPTHKFNLPFNTDLIGKVRITYAQDNKVVLTKEADHETAEENGMTFEEQAIIVNLTQEDTLAISSHVAAQIQMHILTTGGDACASNIVRVPAYRLLDRRVIT